MEDIVIFGITNIIMTDQIRQINIIQSITIIS
jgi:hypothetical protein